MATSPGPSTDSHTPAHVLTHKHQEHTLGHACHAMQENSWLQAYLPIRHLVAVCTLPPHREDPAQLWDLQISAFPRLSSSDP